ncbi:invasin domain 3-containing protein [Aurantibacter sp.]|uniref:invasin domain 3-containing protein n=1 Tax=Aurantibacter sp. TaxID=2807103 RepID=UPI003267BC68
MKINFITRIMAIVLLGSLIAVPIACSSDDGGGDTPEITPVPDPTNTNTTIVTTSPVAADGTTTAMITVTIADTEGTKLTASGGTVALSSSGSATVSSVTDNTDGTYSATVTNTVVETVTISGTLGGTAITNTAEVEFTEPPAVDPTNENTIIEATATTIVEGVSTSTVTVQLADENGDKYNMSGGTVALAVTGSAAISAVTDNEDGTYTAIVTNTVEQTVTVSGTLDDVAITSTTDITFNPDDSNPAQEATQSSTPVGPSLVRINCGGEEVTYDGITFIADQYFSDNTSAYTNELLTEINNTDMDALYLTERVVADGAPGGIKGPMSYDIPVTNGTYTVKLYFAEIYWGVENPEGFEGGNGSRIFNATLEDTPVFTGYDLHKDIGAAEPDTRMYDIEVTDGVLNIILEATVNKPKISAIEVLGNGTVGS